jgi:hypothetical protein
MLIYTWYTEILGEKLSEWSFINYKRTVLFSQGLQDERQANNPLTYAMPLTRGT